MSALWEVRRSHDPLSIPGQVLGAVRAMSLDEAQRKAASRWPGVLLRVSPQSDAKAVRAAMYPDWREGAA